MSNSESIVITGGGGMLAHALRDALAARGRTATFVDRASLDVADVDALRDAFARHRPTLLFNCAAYTKVDLCEQHQDVADAINGRAVGELAKLSREYGTCLVHVSTDFVFDGRSSRPYRADDPVAPISAYGRSKLLGERLLQEFAPPRWMIVRTAWLYGCGGPNFPRTILVRASKGEPLTVVNDQVGSPTYAPDLADAMIDLVDKDARGIWHVTNRGQTSWFDFARAVVEQFKLRADIRPTTSAEWQQQRPGSAPRPAYSVLDGDEFERFVGRPMRPWQDGLRDYHAAVEANGF